MYPDNQGLDEEVLEDKRKLFFVFLRNYYSFLTTSFIDFSAKLLHALPLIFLYRIHALKEHMGAVDCFATTGVLPPAASNNLA